jgi:hypothetical protein
VITLQYTKKKNPNDYYTVTLTNIWFEPGEETTDVFLHQGYKLNFMRFFDDGDDEHLMLIKMEVSGGQITPRINWEAIDLICMGDAKRKTELLDRIRNHFADIDDRLLAYTPKPGEMN